MVLPLGVNCFSNFREICSLCIQCKTMVNVTVKGRPLFFGTLDINGFGCSPSILCYYPGDISELYLILLDNLNDNANSNSIVQYLPPAIHSSTAATFSYYGDNVHIILQALTKIATTILYIRGSGSPVQG